MKENKCLACGYIEDGTPLGEFVEVQGIRGEDIDKAIVCPVCGTVRVVFNYDYYDLKPNNEQKDDGETTSLRLGGLTNDFDF